MKLPFLADTAEVPDLAALGEPEPGDYENHDDWVKAWTRWERLTSRRGTLIVISKRLIGAFSSAFGAALFVFCASGYRAETRHISYGMAERIGMASGAALYVIGVCLLRSRAQRQKHRRGAET